MLPGVGPARAAAFAALGVDSLRAILLLLPRRYEEWARTDGPGPEDLGKVVALDGVVRKVTSHRLGRGRSLVRVLLDTGGSPVETLLFQQPWVAARLPPGTTLRLLGRLESREGRLQLRAPKWELLEPGRPPRLPLAAAGVRPVYAETEGLRSTFTARCVQTLLAAGLPEALAPWAPEEEARALGLPSLAGALRLLHGPRPGEELEPGRRRLALDEAWALLAGARRERAERSGQVAPRVPLPATLERRIRARLPFALHPGQEAAWAQIRLDLGLGRPMARLLQGDVGSGKTAVAFMAALGCVAAGLQVAFMAPTQLLAEQHHGTLAGWLQGSQVRLALLASNLTPAGARRVRADLAAGRVDLVVGTQALIQGGVAFHRLGLAVVDEQQRFGVAQRARLHAGGDGVHLLVLSATPIPRTLALTVYGGLDVARLVGRPPGRGEVATRVVLEGTLEELALAVTEALAGGGRAYVVCARIGSPREPGSVRGVHAWLGQRLPGVSLALAHGDQEEAEREEAFAAFRSGRAVVLVATTVVEVGVDVPEAALMAVLGAESFGLATLHQLRGRVGRGARPARCLLFAARDGAERLRFLEREGDGFRVAEEDLRQRGPGEPAGERQHGSGSFRALRPLQDLDLLERARLALGGRDGLVVEP